MAAPDGREPWRIDRRAVLTLAPAMLLAACATDGGVKTTPLEFAIEADGAMNTNVAGEPSPLVLRVYELKSKALFEQATFFELLDMDTAKLGTELTGKREVELKPADKLEFKRETPIETRHIGVIAGFREIDLAQWRGIIDIRPELTNVIVVKLTALAVTIELVRATRPGLF